jgi:hypothetical protein
MSGYKTTHHVSYLIAVGDDDAGAKEDGATTLSW